VNWDSVGAKADWSAPPPPPSGSSGVLDIVRGQLSDSEWGRLKEDPDFNKNCARIGKAVVEEFKARYPGERVPMAALASKGPKVKVYAQADQQWVYEIATRHFGIARRDN
jgi:hypothetical protein